jgi:glycosyltransferase involved in cell wall biosynthesis
VKRLLWWSNAPWDATGYGVQTALFAPRLAGLGYQMALGAFHGLQGRPLEYQGIPVYPGGRADFGLDVLALDYAHHRADLVITLMDTWKLEPEALAGGMRVACWTPVDADRLGAADRRALEATGAIPIAISRHGYRALRDAGFGTARYVPHGADTKAFAPPPDRIALRKRLGIAGTFAVGINAANSDRDRKGFPEQFWAFRRFSDRHPDTVLMLNTLRDNLVFGGLDLDAVAADAGISDRIIWCDQGAYLNGSISTPELAGWYGALDLLSCCSWGEGFGLPIIEAQACGTPVVVTLAAAMPELAGPGSSWAVDGEPRWHYGHQARWTKPCIAEIDRAYEDAYRRYQALGMPATRAAARSFALGYDADTITARYWRPVLAGIASTSPRPAGAAREHTPQPA